MTTWSAKSEDICLSLSSYTYSSAIIVELLEGGGPEEELGDDEVRPRLHLRLQVQQVVFIRHCLGVSWTYLRLSVMYRYRYPTILYFGSRMEPREGLRPIMSAQNNLIDLSNIYLLNKKLICR